MRRIHLKTAYRTRVALFAISLLAACGDSPGDNTADTGVGGRNDVEPALIAGGGVGSGAIVGEINIHVVDATSGALLPGAAIRLGDFDAVSPLEGMTNGQGLAVFVDNSLAGAQTITVTSAGYAHATWFGVNGANVTVALTPTPTAPIPTATVSGTISGWSGLPTPSLGHYTLAVILYSFTADYGAPENTLPQPMSGDTPSNICVRTPISGSSCNWQMKARVGKQIHYAVILDGNQNDANNPNDDTYEVVGFAAKMGLDLSNGQTVTNEALTMLSVGKLPASVAFPQAPAGVEDRFAFPFIDAGEQGQLVFPLPTLAPGATSTVIPVLEGPFSGFSYRLIGLASAPSGQPRPYSVSLANATFSTTETLQPFLEQPQQLTTNAPSFGFTPSQASLHTVTFADTADNPVWTVLLLSAASSFTLPSVSSNPLSGGGIEMRVSGLDVPAFNPADFNLDSVRSNLARVAEAKAPLN